MNDMSDAELQRRAEEIQRKNPNILKNVKAETIIEVIGEEVGRIRGEILMRVEALEDAVDSNRLQKFRLSIGEWQQEMERERAMLQGEVDALNGRLNRMESENDILRQCLSPKDTLKAADAISMLRSVR